MSNSSPIRVMLVDDHAMLRRGLAAFLLAQDDLELVAEASDGAEAIQLCERVHPDVILMDLIMPQMDGALATTAIRKNHPEIQVIVLTSFKEEHLVQGALKAGAIGYLLKNVSADELANAIRNAHQGLPVLAPEAARVLIHSAAQRDLPALGHDLTDREREVLQLMVKGMDNNQLAEALVVSASTVKFHVSRVLSKLQVGNRTEAVVVALQNHLVD